MKIRVIVNPRAGAGRAGRCATALARALGRAGVDHEVTATRQPGDGGPLARQARDAGADVILVVGGDGTLNEVVQGYIDDDGQPIAGPDLALVPAGTGGDFRRTFDIDGDPIRAVERVLEARPRPLDLAVMRLTADDGKEMVRAFVNIASFGVAGHIDRIVNDSPKWIGGRTAFFLGTARAMAVYRNQPVIVEVDGQPWHEGPVVNVALANGRFFGGGMKVAPNADPADGLLDVVAIGDLTLTESVGFTPRLYKGTHLGSPKVKATRGSRIVASAPRSRTPVLIDLDGEAPGRLPLTAWTLPAALNLRV